MQDKRRPYEYRTKHDIITNLKMLTHPRQTPCECRRPRHRHAGHVCPGVKQGDELKACLTLIAKTDSADPNLTALNDVLASLT